LACSFDGSGSSDPDGTVSGWSWDFGDGASGGGVSPQHSYVLAGTYSVTLTVTDNQGATGSITQAVSVTAPENQPFASDSFNRTVAAGLGSAEVGGVWTTSPSSSFSVASGVGSARAGAGTKLTAYLGSVSRTDADVTMGFALDRVPTGGPDYLTLIGRGVGNSTYSARIMLDVNRGVTLWLARTVNGTETALSTQLKVPGLTYSAGSSLTMRVQVTGTAPAQLRARIWASNATEPSTWQVSGTDSTAALQANGNVGFIDYQSSATTNAPITVRTTNFTARPTIP
jgi:PKD repeat protein